MCFTGAVTIRMRVFDSGVCFIAAHLSSGENEGDELKRNYDYSEIIRRGAFHGDGGALDPDSLAAAASAASLQEGVSKVSLMAFVWERNIDGAGISAWRVHCACHLSAGDGVQGELAEEAVQSLDGCCLHKPCLATRLMQPVVGP